MSLKMVNVDVRDDWMGTRNSELDGFTIRGDELTIYPAPLNRAPRRITPSLRRPLTLYSSLLTIMVLQLLVIHTYTWAHIPSATPSDVLWVAVTTIQESCPHKWSQDVSCGYLMRRWQLVLELLFHCSPMAISLHLCFPLRRSGGLPLRACHFLLSRSRFANNRIVLGNVSW